MICVYLHSQNINGLHLAVVCALYVVVFASVCCTWAFCHDTASLSCLSHINNEDAGVIHCLLLYQSPTPIRQACYLHLCVCLTVQQRLMERTPKINETTSSPSVGWKHVKIDSHSVLTAQLLKWMGFSYGRPIESFWCALIQSLQRQSKYFITFLKYWSSFYSRLVYCMGIFVSYFQSFIFF